MGRTNYPVHIDVMFEAERRDYRAETWKTALLIARAVLMPPSWLEEEKHSEAQYMLTKVEGLSAILMSLPKPLKETEFEIETEPHNFVVALAVFSTHLRSSIVNKLSEYRS